MHILFVVTQFPCASETFIAEQREMLLASGHKVTTLAALGASTDQSVVYANVPPNVFSRILKALRLLPFNCKLHVLRTLRPNLRLMYDAFALREQSQTYDVIHAHFGPNGIRAQQLREAGVIQGPLLTTFYGYDISQYVQGKNPYRELFAQGDRFLSLSETMKHRLRDLGCPPCRIGTQPLSVSAEKFTAAEVARPAKQVTHLLSVARFVPKKGLALAIHAVSHLLGEGLSLHYTIVGDGPLRDELEGLVNALAVQDFVTFTGWQTQAEVAQWMNSADIFLVPSVTAPDGDAEGTPRVMFEAMAMQLPIIATQHSGIIDIIQDGHNGVLVPENNVDALAQAIHRLCCNPKLCLELGNNGRKCVKQKYNDEVVHQQLINQYQITTANHA